MPYLLSTAVHLKLNRGHQQKSGMIPIQTEFLILLWLIVVISIFKYPEDQLVGWVRRFEPNIWAEPDNPHRND